MKNVVMHVLVTTALGLFSIQASAAVHATGEPGISRDTIIEDTLKKDVPLQSVYFVQEQSAYTQVEVSALPEAVTKAVAGKYAGYTIDAAYKGSNNDYKLVLKKEEVKVTVYYSESGGYIKEETVPQTTVNRC